MNRITRQDVINEARTWLHTPYQHQGRIKNCGCDCVGIVIGVMRDLGLSKFDYTNYPASADSVLMGNLLDQNLIRINIEDANIADVFWIKYIKNPQHLAIKTDVGMIHSYNSKTIAKVVEHRIDKKWRRRIVAAYRIPGLID